MIASANAVVSVIVPARNEEVCLGACLESLIGQTGIHLEIIVVDDGSTDRTADIARSFISDSNSIDSNAGADLQARPVVSVISAGPLPQGWTGKNNAMSAGAKIAKGKWLLFTDADTVHRPGSLARAVAEAEQHGAALLSYSPEQEVHGFCEKAVMPVIFAELAATYPPKQVTDPASPIAAANGQYLLISREAYDAVGGHAKIAGDLLEDVAMARLVKSSGRKIFFRYGGDAVRTRMYRSWAQIKEGWTKNLALLFPSCWMWAGRRSLEFVGMLSMLLLGGYFTLFNALGFIRVSGFPEGPLIVASVLAVLTWTRVRRAHFSTSATLLAPIGLPLFVYLLLRSARAQYRHGVRWKGRAYHYKRWHPNVHYPWPVKTIAAFQLLLSGLLLSGTIVFFVMMSYGRLSVVRHR